VADGGIDLAFATSVFIHMRAPSVRRYLAEAGLRTMGLLKGAWAPPAEYDGGQDLFVVVKG
jgi:hypothetical protein